jgi:hypothetical protein
MESDFEKELGKLEKLVDVPVSKGRKRAHNIYRYQVKQLFDKNKNKGNKNEKLTKTVNGDQGLEKK